MGGLSEEGDEDVESKGHSKRWRQFKALLLLLLLKSSLGFPSPFSMFSERSLGVGTASMNSRLYLLGNFERHMRLDPSDIISGRGQQGRAS